MFDHFYSDPHFGHKNIIDYCNRPFRDVGHQTRELIARYNAVVGGRELVLWLGDCFWDMEEAPAILQQLAGRRALVRGNHDKGHARMAALGFEFVTDRLVVEMEGRSVIVSHFPPKSGFRTGDARYANLAPTPSADQLVMHGHTHEKHRRVGNRIHVGVDAWDYRPASYFEVADWAERGR